jgi:hypothetical protein
VSRNRFCDFLADPDSRNFSRFTLILTGVGSYRNTKPGDVDDVNVLWSAAVCLVP